MLYAIVTLVVCWLVGDAYYAKRTTARWRAWEAGISRDEDGIRTGCRAFSVGAGSTALLMLHGFADSPAVYRRMAPKLSEHGYACRAMRLPGFAEPMERYRATSRDQWKQSLRDELAALRHEHEHVVIVAHSLGCAIAADVLLDEPERAEGIVMMAPLIGVSNERSPVMGTETWFKLSERLILFSDLTQMLYPVNVADETLRGQILRDEFIPRPVYRNMFDTLNRIRADVRSFHAPLLMITAGNDPVVDNARAVAFFEDCSSQLKRHIWANRAGHAIPLDYGWEDVSSKVAEFVGQITAPPE